MEGYMQHAEFIAKIVVSSRHSPDAPEAGVRCLADGYGGLAPFAICMAAAATLHAGDPSPALKQLPALKEGVLACA